MRSLSLLAACLVLSSLAITACAEESPDAEWRKPDPANLLYMQLESGTVVIELAPAFAPNTIANIKTLVREKYFDGLAVIRSHDNYVAQWGDPGEVEADVRPIGSAAKSIAAEFQRPLKGVALSRIDSRDAYADIVGFVGGFPAASDGEQIWLTHCYGMFAVARGMEPDSGNGTSLYVVTGHSPRHLDRNLAVVGRVLDGVDKLSSLPRGTNGPLSFYASREEMAPIISIRLGSDVAKENQLNIEIMRTDSNAFANYVKSRTFRNEEFFVEPTGRIEICNLNPPTRLVE